MLRQEYGAKLIGFTGVIKCSKCNNSKPMQIRQDYVKQEAYFIPMGTSYNSIYKFCSICENTEVIIKWKPFFASEEKTKVLLALLEDGKEYTQYWINQLNYKEQEDVMKRLNKLKAYSLVKFLGNIK